MVWEVFQRLEEQDFLFRMVKKVLRSSHNRPLQWPPPPQHARQNMAVGATGAAFLALPFIFPQFYSEKSRFRDAAVAPHFFPSFFNPDRPKMAYFCRNKPFSCGRSSALQKGALFTLFNRRMSSSRRIDPKKFNIPRVSVAFHLRCDRNPGNVKLFGVNSLLIMSTGSDKV